MLRKRFAEIEWFFWVCAGGVICFFSWKAHLGSFHDPGPGFVAFASGLFVLAVGLVMLISRLSAGEVSEGDTDPLPLVRNIPWARFAYTVGLLFAYAILLGALGYLVTTFLLMFGLLFNLKKRNYVTAFLTSAAIVGGTYLIFEVWLQTQLPRGIFPWW